MPHFVELKDNFTPSSGRGHRRKFSASMIARLAIMRRMIENGVSIENSFECTNKIVIEKIKFDDAFVFWKATKNLTISDYIVGGLNEESGCLIKLVGSGRNILSIIQVCLIVEEAIDRLQDWKL